MVKVQDSDSYGLKRLESKNALPSLPVNLIAIVSRILASLLVLLE
jgi:hypothetical protein